jgi:hypothetical protein
MMSTPSEEKKRGEANAFPSPPSPCSEARKSAEGREGLTYLGIIWAVEPFGKKSWLGVWYATKTADSATDNDALLAADNANLETRVLRSIEYFVPV